MRMHNSSPVTSFPLGFMVSLVIGQLPASPLAVDLVGIVNISEYVSRQTCPPSRLSPLG